MNGDIRRKTHENRQFPPPLYLTPPLKGFALELCIGAGGVKKNFQIGLAILIQYRRVTDSHPAGHPASQPASQPDTLLYLTRSMLCVARKKG